MIKAKVAWFFTGAALFLVSVIYVFGDQLILYTVQYGLKKSLPQYQTSIKSARIQRDTLFIHALQAKNKSIRLEASEVRVSFNLADLSHRKISKIDIKGLVAQAQGSAEEILSTISFVRSSERKPGLSLQLGKLEISDLTLDIQSVDLKLKGSMSFLADIGENRLTRMKAQISTSEMNGLSIKNISISFDETNAGKLSVQTVGYQRLVTSDIHSPFSLEGNMLKVEPLSGTALDGTLGGRFWMRLDGDKDYALNLILQQLSLPALIADLKFGDKMSMTGRFLGKISIHGNRLGVEDIDGTLSGSSQGGDLVILDEKFLGDIATRMHQPLELVKAGLKEYHYESGQARLLKNGRDLGLDLSLDGPKGKRQLSTVFHDTV